jgi:hypothetical protein
MGTIAQFVGTSTAPPVAARVSLISDPFYAEFAARKRRERVSWSAIAQQIGKCEVDVRAAFDPEFEGEARTLPIPVWRGPKPRIGERQLEMLRLLAKAPIQSGAAGVALGMAPSTASNMLQVLMQKGWARVGSWRLWAITDEGASVLERLA